jgi:L-amino acid N-acyltransferase YncA
MCARLADGSSIVLRPLRRGEARVLETVFAGLSSRSRTQRYLVSTPHLSSSTRRVLAEVDGRDHVAWLALVRGCPVGICRYVRTATDTAEVAFEVIDAEQGRGIGSVLLDAVTTVAYSNGIEWLEAVVKPDNAASAALLTRVGVTLSFDDGVLEGRGRLRLMERARVNRRAVLALAGHPLSASSHRLHTSLADAQLVEHAQTGGESGAGSSF